MRSILFVTVALCLALPLAAFAQPDARAVRRDRPAVTFVPLEVDSSRSAGLFVGINEFTAGPEVRPLRFAVNDAIALAHLFVVELKRVPPENCYLALSGEPAGEGPEKQLAALESLSVERIPPSKVSLLRTLLTLRRIPRSESDLLVLSFSTHGYAEDGIAYVMPADGLRALLADTALKLTTIEEQAARSKAGHRLLLVDACQERVGGDERALTGMNDPSSKNLMPAAFAAAIAKPTGQAKLSSCDIGEYSYEDPTLGHGVFTHAFVEALRGGAAVDSENLVRLGAVARFVEQRVSTWADEKNRALPEGQRKTKQSPSFHGPEASRNLPLAAKGEELASLLATLERRVSASGPYTAELHEALAGQLARLDPTDELDRQLLASVRDFTAGRLAVRFFVPYLERDRRRWRESRVGARAGEVRKIASLGLELVWCPPGSFRMGSPPEEKGRDYDEGPVQVTLSHGFWLGKTEVTQGQWKQVMGTEPWKGKDYVREGPNYAQSYVSWEDARDFCAKLTAAERAAGRLPSDMEYALPTEAQWEYACRAGTTTRFGYGDSDTQLGRYAWYEDNAVDAGEEYTHEVGQKLPNAWGLHDMHGNAWEWCADGYRAYLPGGPDSFVAPEGLSKRVIRGGGWMSNAGYSRSALRHWTAPANRGIVGFRVAAVPAASR